MNDSLFKRMFHPKAKGKAWWVFVFIAILSLVCSFVVFGDKYNNFVKNKKLHLPLTKEIPFRLGLDLLGGSQLVYHADVSAVPAADRAMAVEGARDVIEKRVNVFGVSEPLVQVNKTTDGDYRITVELAGIKDINEAIKKIGETPLLEFKEENTNKRAMTAAESKQLSDYNNQAQKKAEEVLGKLLSGGDFKALAQKYSEDSATKDKSGDLGWLSLKNRPDIIDAVSTIEVGKTSRDLKKSSQGYELFKVEDKRIKKDANGLDEKEVKAAHLLICFKDTENCDSNLTKEEAYNKIKKIKDQATTKNFADLVKLNSTEPGSKDSKGELGWFGRDAMVKPFADTVFAQKVGTISYIVETKFGYHLIYKESERTIAEYKVDHILIKTKTEEDIIGPQSEWKNTELTGKNLKRAVVEFNPRDNSPEVSLEFDDEGSKMFEKITERNTGKPVAIFLDGYPISIPKVNEKITGGKASISGKFDIVEAKTLAKRLNSGALPVPISLINQQTIGASLGRQSIDASLFAGFIGLLLVAIFMIVFYRLPGVLSVVAIFVYGVLSLTIFKLWPVTITLSGIAGFVLSIGMAVDANILIFERLREELRNGKTISQAITEGFSRAWPSIWDGHVTTIISCLVLMTFSTSVVKGFAVTLFLGILISLFTAITVTRNFLKLVSEQWLEKHKNLLIGVKK